MKRRTQYSFNSKWIPSGMFSENIYSIIHTYVPISVSRNISIFYVNNVRLYLHFARKLTVAACYNNLTIKWDM